MNNKQQNYLILAAIGLIITAITILYVKVLKPVLDGAQGLVTGITDPFTETKDEKKQNDRSKDAANVQSESKNNPVRIISGQKATKTVNEWRLIADSIDGYTNGFIKDVDKAAYEICRVKNTTDLIVLKEQFGLRVYAPFYISQGKFSLDGIVKMWLSSKRDAINKNLKSKNISKLF